MIENDVYENINENVLLCPNCKEYFIMEKLNCGIFRHGIVKENGKQMDPHSSKDLCDYYIRENKIYGCGKPFQVLLINNKLETKICDYA
jgi:hypothetical protein